MKFPFLIAFVELEIGGEKVEACRYWAKII